MIAKFISVALAVASGVYGGNEGRRIVTLLSLRLSVGLLNLSSSCWIGPMIHIGSSMGKVLSQGSQMKNGRYTALFKRFRNMYDRRNFIR